RSNSLAIAPKKLSRKFIFLGLSGLAGFVTIIPQLLAGIGYGRALLSVDAPVYPEIELNDRFHLTDSWVYDFFFKDFLSTFIRTLGEIHNIYIFIALFVFVFALIIITIRIVYRENPKSAVAMILLA